MLLLLLLLCGSAARCLRGWGSRKHVNLRATRSERQVHGGHLHPICGGPAPLALGAVFSGACVLTRGSVGSALQEPAAARAPEAAPGELL